jgi:hydroxymethylglutaryl-CoA lyase
MRAMIEAEPSARDDHDPLARVPHDVSVYEVSLRDGLQNEPSMVPLAEKLRLARALVAAGLRRIEATSFVAPKWVPQLADASELLASLEAEGIGAASPSGERAVMLSALVPNARGLERAFATRLPEIAIFMSASETHNRMNINKSIDATIEVFREIVPPALAQGVRVRAYVSTVWGCPYEGDVAIATSVSIAERLLALGCYEVSLGDTIGVGTPRKTRDVVRAMASALGLDRVALHFHDTRGTALSNVLMGLELGVRTFDASVGGLGGCPYAPGASGNLATEDLVFLLDGLGVSSGVDLGRLVEAGRVAAQAVGRPLPGKVHQAGTFQARPAP